MRKVYPSIYRSFEDHFREIRAILECERRKYPHIDPRPLMAQFYSEAIMSDATYEEVAAHCDLPNRRNSKKKINVAIKEMVFSDGTSKPWVVTQLIAYAWMPLVEEERDTVTA